MLSERRVQGHRALLLENDLLAVTVLPDKGADIAELLYKPDGVQFFMRTPNGLRPPGNEPPADFLENYEGGWQELFPNAGDETLYRGVNIPFHGDVALLPWEVGVERNDEDETCVVFSVQSRSLPLQLDRRMRLRQGETRLDIEERIRNSSDAEVDFVWGHHLVLGGNFLEDGCRLDVAAGTLLTPDELYEPATARLAPGQRQPWPMARGRSGEAIDLREIPGPAVHSHDDVYLTDLSAGWAEVANARLGLSFRLTWDKAVFPYVVVWQPFGGADMPPLTGIYGLGLEPWVSRYNLEGAVQHGEALRLATEESIGTRLSAEIGHAKDRTGG